MQCILGHRCPLTLYRVFSCNDGEWDTELSLTSYKTPLMDSLRRARFGRMRSSAYLRGFCLWPFCFRTLKLALWRFLRGTEYAWNSR